MSTLLTMNMISFALVFCIGQISCLNPGMFSKNSDKPWQLDIKKAKTVLKKAASNGEVLQSRRKRFFEFKITWPWEEWEEEEESEENRECQRRCWSAWAPAPPCSVRCGNGGSRTRRRQRVRTDCSCPGVDWRSETCGNSCQNGGTPRLRDCSCPVGFTSDCCETRVKCGNPGSPPHGSVSPAGNTHFYNTRAHYSCDSGWEISGGTNPRTCQNNGLWSGSIPGCTRVPCPHPGAPEDGSVAPFTGFVYETLVQFSCNPGFSLEGSETSVCQSNRQWSHNPPRCNRISCGDPGGIPNGIVTGTSYMFEDVLTYSCNPGFTLIGSSERICQADGTWSCDVPRCTSSVSLIPKCPTINQILHGSLTLSDDNYYQSIAEYACDEGYYLNGDSHRACQADQQWSGTEPSCVRITCPRLTNPANGQVNQPAGSPEYGSQATFACNSGYRLDGDESVTCGGLEASGVWSATSPLCHAVNCGAPVRPDNGRIIGTEFTFMHTVEIQCAPGFYLDGPAELTCNENAAWVGGESSPMCSDCPLDHYKSEDSSAGSCTRCPDNSHTTSTTSNNILQCICDPGYEGPDGGPCTIITCPVLTVPNNGAIEPCGNEYRSVCNLTCNPGHIVSAGDLSRECLSTGNWGGETLKCTVCPKDTYQNETYRCEGCPDNAVTSGTASVFADCTCTSGFVNSSSGDECLDIDECSGDHPCEQECINMLGSFRCNCMSGWILDGLPEDNPTNCVKATGTCPADQLIPPPNGGFVCGVVNMYEEYCSAFCNPGYEIIKEEFPDEYITCNTATGWQWSHVIDGNDQPLCAFIVFQNPTYSGSVFYFEAECAGLTEEQKATAISAFIENLESHGVCSQQPGDACQVESADIICGETFTFRRKKRQAQTDTLTIKFNFTISVGSECTEVNCQEKFDRLVQIEVQRIEDELHSATQLDDNRPGCPLCLNDPNTGIPLQMSVSGEVQVPCPDGYQRKGYSCRQCAPGMYHDKETGKCTLCPAGEYQPDAGQTSCLSCPYLTALNKLGAKKCPVPPEETYACQTNNPCLKSDDPDFRMFYSHTNANKYIQCTGHEGGCYEMPCPATLVWNPSSNICAPLSLIPLNSIY